MVKTTSFVVPRMLYQVTYNKGPLTDIGGGGGANGSYLTRDLFIGRAEFVSKIDMPGGTSVSMTQEHSCTSFLGRYQPFFFQQEVS